MRRLSIVALLALAAAACQPGDTASENAEAVARDFAEAFFNHDYAEALRYVTPESERQLRFAASNISEADVALLNGRGKEATVSVKNCEQTADTAATAVIVVEDYLDFDSIEGSGQTVDTGEYRFKLVKRGRRWQVAIEN